MLRPLFCLSALLLAFSTGLAHAADCPALLKHRFTTLQGQPLDLCAQQDKVILVVNTASKCGYTRQFEPLEALSRRWRDQGLLVIGFPSNDFNQELASNQEVAEFCKLTYFVDFPMIEKAKVSGAQAMPFYRQLAAATGQAPRWNFHKYVIAPGGKQVWAFASEVEPDSPQLLKVIQPYLRTAERR